MTRRDGDNTHPENYLMRTPARTAFTDAAGNSVTSGKAVVDPSNQKHMSVVPNPLTSGVYTVSSSAVVAVRHRTQGHYTFTVR